MSEHASQTPSPFPSDPIGHRQARTGDALRTPPAVVSEPGAPAPGLPPGPATPRGAFVERLPAGRGLVFASTSLGGLLFLLPVLQRLGLPAWLDALPAPVQAAWVWRVLVRAAGRVDHAVDDPLLQEADLGDAAGAGLAPHGAPAPLAWQADALQPSWVAPRLLALRLQQAGDADTQARLWVLAARRWLRRHAGLGLAELVCRRAALHATPTHLDLHFALQDADLRVRRAGLDLDPGWLPWWGRVVGFHFHAHFP